MSGWDGLAHAGSLALAAEAEAWSAPRQAQVGCLSRILRLADGSAFSREHRNHAAMRLENWRARVPIRDYDDYRPWIERIIAGEPEVLTGAPVVAVELTGGSSGGRRAIPYTQALLDDFRVPLLAWFGDLLRHIPAIAAGRAYFALSPVLQRPVVQLGPHPVGLPSDLAYFGADIAADLGPLLVWHPSLVTEDAEAWSMATAYHLALAEDLSLTSVWSPTFLTQTLDRIATDPDLPRQIHDGVHGLAGRPRRARALDLARRDRLDVPSLWPRLALVSAWGDASSARSAAELTARLGDVRFQPKGLLATEGFFTMPLEGLSAPMPILTSCFLEFEDDAGGIHLVDELETGATYGLVITTSGGLQRYRIGDRVIAEGPPEVPRDWPYPRPSQRLNMLRFAGRQDGSDLVGEKLSEAFVLSCLDGLPPHAFIAAASDSTRYELWIDTREAPDRLDEYLTLLEGRLRHNPQYDYARRLSQLGPPVLRAAPALLRRYRQHRLSLGHRLSDIKPLVLLPRGPLHPDLWPS